MDKSSWCWIKTPRQRRPATPLQATALHRQALCSYVVLQLPCSYYCLVSPHQQSVRSTRWPTLLHTTRCHSYVRILGQTQKIKGELRHNLGKFPDSRKNPTAYWASIVHMSRGQKISLHSLYLGFGIDTAHNELDVVQFLFHTAPATSEAFYTFGRAFLFPVIKGSCPVLSDTLSQLLDCI